jgi:hypothetical protein
MLKHEFLFILQENGERQNQKDKFNLADRDPGNVIIKIVAKYSFSGL